MRRTWQTGHPAPAGMFAYTHLIRGANDPTRSPRAQGGRADRAPHRTLAKTSRAEWARRLVAHLGDGVPRTFNRIGVELLDLTADVLFTTPVNEALWDAVAAGLIEHTMVAPIEFRRRQRRRAA